MQAQTDGLTNLSNHATFHARLDSPSSAADRFSVLMIDLDEFKIYNDSYGHQAGDPMLREIAGALLDGMPGDRHAVFRYGGDEFTILLPGADQAGALAVAEKVRAAVTGAGRQRGPDALLLTCSIGVASFPDDATDAPSLLFAADRAAYLSKHTGRDLVSTAAQGAERAASFMPTPPTPVDEPSAPAAARRGADPADGGRRAPLTRRTIAGMAAAPEVRRPADRAHRPGSRRRPRPGRRPPQERALRRGPGGPRGALHRPRRDGRSEHPRGGLRRRWTACC